MRPPPPPPPPSPEPATTAAAAPPPPPKPRLLDLETSGEEVPPLLSQWEQMMPGEAPEPAPPAAPASPDEGLELAAPWEFVGYQGDAAADLGPPPPAGPAAAPASPEDAERPPDPETAAQIAEAVAKGELDWSTVIAFDGEKPQPEDGAAPPEAAPEPTMSLTEALGEAERALRSATQAAMISEALLACCQRGFGRAFHFIIQYGVALMWRGFGPGSDGAVMAFRPDLKEPSMFKTAVESGRPSVVTAPETSTDEAFFWAISPPPPGYAVAVPVMVGGAARELLCVVGEEAGPSPEVLGALERLSAFAAEAHARLSGHP
ncbi:MAG TPA: hypothetical protein VND93_00295 [Myxococcales bacterium]|nr:hypothetical protein [Myxococcales bacterium]